MHNFACVKCHEGNDKSKKISEAHKGLVAKPSHLNNMMRYCGECHYDKVNFASNSLHFTLENEINTIFKSFFPNDNEVYNIHNIPYSDNPLNEKEVLSEALRKRCLLCHPYYEGENYRGTRRGTGCASCHLQNKLLEPKNHRFDNKPADKHCLSCHYGNFVGWDYYGRFEKDFEEDYRDIIGGKFAPREYGVEWHELREDVHKKAGLSCIDCHRGGFCGTGGDKHKKDLITCLDCHEKGDYIIEKKAPLMDKKRTGHRDVDLRRVSCSVCHAQWSFNDYGRELTYSPKPDFYTWVYLSVQGSYEIENFFIKVLVDKDYKPQMMDKINGKRALGLWFMGFKERRWYPIAIGIENAKFVVMRPILDLKISYYNEQLGRSFYLEPQVDVWRSYFPHTIGKPDINRVMEIEKSLR